MLSHPTFGNLSWRYLSSNTTTHMCWQSPAHRSFKADSTWERSGMIYDTLIYSLGHLFSSTGLLKHTHTTNKSNHFISSITINYLDPSIGCLVSDSAHHQPYPKHDLFPTVLLWEWTWTHPTNCPTQPKSLLMWDAGHDVYNLSFLY